VQQTESSTFLEQVKSMAWPFWAANIMEMIERLAYYGVRVVIPIYIAQADEIGGLHFTQTDKGFIFLVWALVQSILPVFTGGFADRYGYKKQIVVAVIIVVRGCADIGHSFHIRSQVPVKVPEETVGGIGIGRCNKIEGEQFLFPDVPVGRRARGAKTLPGNER